MKVAVTGASGVLGTQVSQRLRSAGHEVIAISRRPPADANWRQADIASGEGLRRALEGAEVVVHAASAAAEVTRIKRTDIEGTARVVREAEAAGVGHLAYISIVGIDRIDYGYYRAKLAAEDAIRAGGVPWSILRATQFHEFIDRILRATARGPFLFVPRGVSDQPVAASEVAARLAEISSGTPTGSIQDFGGPEVLTAEELGRAWLGRRGLHRRLVRFPIPPKPGAGFRAGFHLCPQNRDGTMTWGEWLEQAYRRGRVPTAYGKRAGGDR